MKIEWHVGDVIRKLRESAELTQQQLAKLAGMPRPATIGKIEETGRYQPLTLKKISAALKVRDLDILAMVPSGESVPQPIIQSTGSLCSNPDHARYQVMLDKIFHADAKRAEWIMGNVITFCDALSAPLGGVEETNNRTASPFDYDEMPPTATAAKKSKKVR